MALLFSAIMAIIVGLSLATHPAKLIKDIQAKTETNAKVMANTSLGGRIDTQNLTAKVSKEANAELETRTPSKVAGDTDEELEAKGQVRVSAFNHRSGKFMFPFIPRVAVDHSESLEAVGNLTIGSE